MSGAHPLSLGTAVLAAAEIRADSWVVQPEAAPKTLRYRILHTAARLTCSGRRRRLKIAASSPWAAAIVTAWDRITALTQAP